MDDDISSVDYDPPAVIYDGKITTRAGTSPCPPWKPGCGGDGFDPGLLFGDD